MHTNTTPILIRTPSGLDSNKTQLFSLQNLLLGKILITTPLYWPGYSMSLFQLDLSNKIKGLILFSVFSSKQSHQNSLSNYEAQNMMILFILLCTYIVLGISYSAAKVPRFKMIPSFSVVYWSWYILNSWIFFSLVQTMNRLK